MNLSVCNSSEYINVTGLFNFFYVPQDLIDRINSYFHRIAFQRNLLLIGFEYSNTRFFPINISSFHWNGVVHTCKEKSWWKVAAEYRHIPHSFKGVILLCESILLYNPFNSAVPVLYKMAKHTLKILQHLLQGF